MPDALGDGREATLVIPNTSVKPVLLAEGDVVGCLQQCTLVPPSDQEIDIYSGVSVCRPYVEQLGTNSVWSRCWT